jgi:hypothetical protein
MKKNNALWTDRDLEKLKQLAGAGVSLLRIASKLGRTMSAVRTVARDRGVRIKTKQEVRMAAGLTPKWRCAKVASS